MAKVSLDLVRGKSYPQSEDAFEPMSSSVRVVQITSYSSPREGGPHPETGAHYDVVSSFTTRTIATSNDPFYNENFDFVTPFDAAHTSAKSHPKVDLLFEVNDGEKPVFFGRTTIEAKHNGKGEKLIDLFSSVDFLRTNAADVPSDIAPIPGSTLTIRYKTHLPKLKKEVVDVNADISLAEQPKFSGSRPLVPQASQYVWWHLMNDDNWTSELNKVVVETWANSPDLNGSVGGGSLSMSSSQSPKKGSSGGRAGSASAQRETTPKNIADILVSKMKCKRSHQLLTKVRLIGSKFAAGHDSILPGHEEEAEAKVKFLENCLVREDMIADTADQSSGKIRDKLTRLWMYFAANMPTEGQAPYINFELSSKLDSTPFGRQQQEVMQSCLLRHLIPSLSQTAADAIAKEDCDPKHAIDHTRKAEGSTADGGPSSPVAPAADGSPTVAKTPKVKEKEFFFKQIKHFACRLCDTLTEYEMMAILDNLLAPIAEAREICKTLVPALSMSTRLPTKPGSAKPSSGRRKSSARGSTAGGRRKSSVANKSTTSVGSSKHGGGSGGGEEKLTGPLHLKNLDELGRPVKA